MIHGDEKMEKKRKRDLLLTAGLLALAGVLYLFLRPGPVGAWAVVTVDGMETARYPLTEDRTVTIGTTDWNVLVISDGGAAVADANCGDHTCVRMGRISREGETIVCLPHRLVVEITGTDSGGPDATVGG